MKSFLRLSLPYVLVCLMLGCASAPVGPQPVHRSDYAREQRWASEVVPGLVVGEAVWLEASQRKFLAIYTPAAKPRGAIILAHGLGVNPDYGVIGALRTRLADGGYTTLSIQMPILAADAPAERYPALFPEAGDRIAAALAWLQAKKYRRIALVSHSMGTRMANYFVALRPDAPLDAWVALSDPNGEFEPGTAGRIRIFDIYAEKDYPAVVQGAPDRAKVLARVPGSSQAMVFGTDHYYAGKDKELAELIELLLSRPTR